MYCMSILRVHALHNEKGAKTTTLRVVPYSPTSLPSCKPPSTVRRTHSPSAPHVLAPSPSRGTSKAKPNAPSTPPLPPCTPPPHRFPRRRRRVVGADYSTVGLSKAVRTRRAKTHRKRTLSRGRRGWGEGASSPALARSKDALKRGAGLRAYPRRWS